MPRAGLESHGQSSVGRPAEWGAYVGVKRPGFELSLSCSTCKVSSLGESLPLWGPQSHLSKRINSPAPPGEMCELSQVMQVEGPSTQ